MKTIALTLAAAALLAAILVPGAAAQQNIELTYFNTVALMDEFQAILPDGSLVHLIYTPSGTIEPPSLWTGLPTGDNILWATTDTDEGIYFGTQEYDSSLIDGTGSVYIRFFNAPSLVYGELTYYGLTPLHTLGDGIFPELPFIDFYEMGLYLWTEYPFMIIPEPAAWITMIPAMGMGLLAYRKSLKKKKPQKKAARTGAK